MADKPVTVRLRTNLPERMTLKYVNYSEGKDWKDPETGTVKKMPASLALVGQQEGVGAVRIYVPLTCGKDLTELGYLTKTGGKDKFGGPEFRVTGQPLIDVKKTEDGKKKLTSITPAGPAGPGSPAPVQQSPKPNGAPPVSQTTFQTLGDRYAKALTETIRAYKEAGLIAPNTEQLHAGSACIFIESCRQHIDT